MALWFTDFVGMALVLLSSCKATKRELWIGGFFTVDVSDGGWSSAGVLPSVKMALADVNNSTKLLKDYILKMDWRDTKCKRGYGVRQFVDLVHSPPQKIMLIGGGCSVGTEATAEVSHYWNLVQVSYSAYSLKLSDKKLYPLHFRTCYEATSFNIANIAFLKHFRWRRVAIIYQNEALFSTAVADLRKLLDKDNFSVAVMENVPSKSDSRIQVKSIKDSDARIIIGVFYEDMAIKVFCQAYREGLYGEHYLWLIGAWFGPKWWENTNNTVDCTIKQMSEVTDNYFGLVEKTWSDNPGITISGQTAAELKNRYVTKARNSPYRVNEYSVFGYDAIWAIALTLNRSISLLKRKGKYLDNFTYNDTTMSSIFREIMTNMSFLGMSGRVRFDYKGDRVGTLDLEQLQDGKEVKVGITDNGVLILNGSHKIHWKGGSPPTDRVVVEYKLVPVSPSLFYTFSTISGFGIATAFGFLIFNIYCGDKRFIRMSSPRLNNITVVGCIIIYIATITFGLDGRLLNPSQFSSVCQVKAWLVCIGFTLAFGAMFSKTWRVHVLFIKKLERRSIRDQRLLALVAALLTVDIIVLTTWQIVDPLHRTTEYLPKNEFKTKHVVQIQYLEYCHSQHKVLWKSILMVYKGLLLLFSAFLSWETRNVTIVALNDSRNIGMSVYTVLLCCLASMPVFLFITGMPDLTYGLASVVAITCTTLILCFMFIPKILMMSKPEEELVAMTSSLMCPTRSKVSPELAREGTAKAFRSPKLNFSLGLNSPLGLNPETSKECNCRYSVCEENSMIPRRKTKEVWFDDPRPNTVNGDPLVTEDVEKLAHSVSGSAKKLIMKI